MISSLAGDILGSRFEFHTDESKLSLFTGACRFTDDTILLTATMDAILNNKYTDGKAYSDAYLKYAQRYPKHGYGKRFAQQVASGKLEPYNSYGNGSAMRVAPIAWAFFDAKTILEQAKMSAEITHSHPEGIRGAQAVCYLIWLCKNGMPKPAMKKAMVELFGDTYKKETKDFEKGKFDITAQGTVPLCASIFYETNGFEEAMWKAIDMGGDVDTNCCIIGAFCLLLPLPIYFYRIKK